MLKTTIRWQNVARAGAIGAAVIGAIATLPTLLAPPEPKPLPADVGLDSATVGAQAFAPADVSPSAAAREASDGHENRPSSPSSKPNKRGALSVGGGGDQGRDRDTRSIAGRGRDLEPPSSVAGDAPAAAPDPAPEPQPTPVSAPTSPPSDPASPPEPDPAPQPPPQPAAAGGGNDAQSARGPSEFGFEQ